ncbi:MAG: hypothetical protein ACE361_06885 [Aureliella sp.]
MSSASDGIAAFVAREHGLGEHGLGEHGLGERGHATWFAEKDDA